MVAFNSETKHLERREQWLWGPLLERHRTQHLGFELLHVANAEVEEIQALTLQNLWRTFRLSDARLYRPRWVPEEETSMFSHAEVDEI